MTADAQQQPHPLALPETLSPDALDALTDLASTLSRLRPPQSASTLADGKGAGGPAGPGSGPGHHGSQPPAVTGTTPLPAPAGAQGELHLKDVPSATDALRVKLQRARAQIRSLPDVGRTVAQQEEELRELEDRMRRQKVLMEQLQKVGVRFGSEEEEAAAPTPQVGAGDKMET
ncbi:uncharacterized protein E0L32_002704 [Thyridium curvatum]|uniref:Mediator of RNA polymerase II transcription subunit 9 n=1 Tax=Thyridium curvatum TaxID=1093900 RepID=A0A507B4Y1_9PEZI|nr:uncharacterized protein E0L32_002704 [Thyridium curvatum]TPX18195.1 hypothetical protein E0L32_002704 [Thyridium curvatum]